MHFNVTRFPRNGNLGSADLTIDEKETNAVLVQAVVNDSCPGSSKIPSSPVVQPYSPLTPLR